MDAGDVFAPAMGSGNLGDDVVEVEGVGSPQRAAVALENLDEAGLLRVIHVHRAREGAVGLDAITCAFVRPERMPAATLAASSLRATARW